VQRYRDDQPLHGQGQSCRDVKVPGVLDEALPRRGGGQRHGLQREELNQREQAALIQQPEAQQQHHGAQ
jgi:hypothetical protein